MGIAGRKLGWRALICAFVTLAGIGVGLTASKLQAQPTPLPPYLAAFPNFAPKLTPHMPGDVNLALKKQLEASKQFSKVQREFDLYSWQMFLALNWPTNSQGQAAPAVTDTRFGAPHWTLWHNSSDIYRTDGAKPVACGLPPKSRTLVLRRDLAPPVSKGLAAFSTAATANADPRATRFLGVISAVGELNAASLSEIDQAFAGPLIDQNGEFVFYEIMIDPNEVNYICDKGLYNINGQVAFTKGGGKVDMPTGVSTQNWSGSFELKFAWRILRTGKDDFSRYYTSPAVVMDQGPDGKPFERKVVVGMVGMHIGHKSQTSPQWIWSTFEQVDNIDVDAVAHPKLNPSFFDPNCAMCAVDQQPIKASNGAYPRIPTQAWRAIPIPGDKQALNRQAQAVLARLGSVWQYYQLIDTQWPTDPTASPSAWDGGLPNAIANKPGGAPTPVFLTNITMETYFQKGNQPACDSEELPSGVKCPTSGPALPPVWNSVLNNSAQPVKPGINTLTFATESCMGCHSSAGVWTSYDPKAKKGTKSGQLTGDFSWLLTQKASYQTAPGGTPTP
jgi:hypothetical protein